MRLYVIIMSRMSFRVNLHPVVCLNVKELLTWSRCHIWSLSDSNVIWTHNHLVCNQTPNHLARLARWLGCVASTYLYGAFDCFLLPCMSSRVNLHSSLPECQGTPCLKQVPYLKFKWQQHDSNSWLLSLQTNTQPFSQTGQMIKLWCDYLSVWCI